MDFVFSSTAQLIQQKMDPALMMEACQKDVDINFHVLHSLFVIKPEDTDLLG